ncbi:Malonyl CoA-acyl carrier protein transacylase [Chlamydiales bacterium SCGC AG-110-P3]|nr:Malonyl CoA-acyl carrier protein transacylase [Chlamydiales bacterium SCGC AG-110-P3]
MTQPNNIAFIFPGQGAQYPGMGKDFAANFSVARETFEQANDLLKMRLSDVMFEGPADLLTQTKHCQVALYVDSIAILRTLATLSPDLTPSVCAGLSLGEYTALTASGRLTFEECLPLVQYRGQYMHDACESMQGTMAVVIGLDAAAVEAVVADVAANHDVWTANFNCPGQVVISGSTKGVEAASALAKERGARRVLALPVHGAFHSGLMAEAEQRLAAHVDTADLSDSDIDFVMNVPGDYVKDLEQIRSNLIKQVTSPVRWEQGVRAMMNHGVDLFVEIGCGKTLAGMNKRIGVTVPTISIDKVSDLQQLQERRMMG